jgi:hypothetical protein
MTLLSSKRTNGVNSAVSVNVKGQKRAARMGLPPVPSTVVLSSLTRF